MNKVELRIRVLLSLQRAFIGAIRCDVRCIKCEWNDHEISVNVIINGEISSDDYEKMSEVETEITADFPEHNVLIACSRLDEPSKIDLFPQETVIFRRWE